MAQAGDQQQFCLRWNDFQTNMVSSFKHLRDEKSFTDVTLGKNAIWFLLLQLCFRNILHEVIVAYSNS